jgi:hypothetical protein
MVNGANNCCLLLKNHKKLPHMNCAACREIIAPTSSPQVIYFLSFQTLLAIRHADSSAKFIRALQQVAHWLREPVNKVKKKLSVYKWELFVIS